MRAFPVDTWTASVHAADGVLFVAAAPARRDDALAVYFANAGRRWDAEWLSGPTAGSLEVDELLAGGELQLQ